MKYVSIDIESTGLNIEKCSILEIGMVVDDLEDVKPFRDLKIARLIVLSSGFYCEPTAVVMNADLIKEISEYDYSKGLTSFRRDNLMQYYCRDNSIGSYIDIAMRTWLGFTPESGRCNILPAGKNFDKYDRKMLDKAGWLDKINPSAAIDPGSMFWKPGDERLPSLDECMKRCGYKGATGLHSAVNDALDVVRCIRFAKLGQTYET